jgi:hypothetical protein
LLFAKLEAGIFFITLFNVLVMEPLLIAFDNAFVAATMIITINIKMAKITNTIFSEVRSSNASYELDSMTVPINTIITIIYHEFFILYI